MECPIRGQLSKLQTGVGYDHPSMIYSQATVPVQVTVQPSSICGASLGMFSATTIGEGVYIDVNEGDKVSKVEISTT